MADIRGPPGTNAGREQGRPLPVRYAPMLPSVIAQRPAGEARQGDGGLAAPARGSVMAVWWEYLVIPVLMILGIYGFLVIAGFETRLLSRKQRRQARKHGDG